MGKRPTRSRPLVNPHNKFPPNIVHAVPNQPHVTKNPVARPLIGTNMVIFRSTAPQYVLRECKLSGISKLYSILPYSEADITLFRNAGVEILPITQKRTLMGLEQFFRWTEHEHATIGIQCFGGRHTSRQYAAYALARKGKSLHDIETMLLASGSNSEDVQIIIKDVTKFLSRHIAEVLHKTHKH